MQQKRPWVLVVLLAFVCTTANGAVTLFHDDFDDNFLDLTQWSIGGNDVREREGILELREITDAGGWATTPWVEFSPAEKVIIERDVLHHYANSYFIGRLEVFVEGSPEYTFGVNTANMSYGGAGYVQMYGTCLFRNDGSGHSVSDIAAGHSESVPALWNVWFHEKIVYDPVTGVLEYFVNDVLTISYDVGAIPNLPQYRMQVRTRPWGWYTGHYQYVDNMHIVQDAPPANAPPVLAEVGNLEGAEGELLEFSLTATDPDGDNLTFSGENLPEGATVSPEGLFSWTPTFEQSGSFQNVGFCVTDDGDPLELDCEVVTITVGNTDRPPVFAPIPLMSIDEEELLCFSVSAADPDGEAVALSATDLPSGALFDASTGEISWIPSNTQAGTYMISFAAWAVDNPDLVAVQDAVVTVGDVPTPVETATSLVDTIEAADLPKNDENAYLANLKKVAAFIEAGKRNAANNQIDAFITKVNNDLEKGDIDALLANDLLALAADLKFLVTYGGSRLAHLVELAKRTAVGIEMKDYIDYLYHQELLHLTAFQSEDTTHVIFGYVEQPWDALLSGDTLACTFEAKGIYLNDLIASDLRLASTLIHEVSHYRDMVEASAALQAGIQVAVTEISAHSNQYDYYQQAIAVGDFTEAEYTALGSTTTAALETSSAYVASPTPEAFAAAYAALVDKGYEASVLDSQFLLVCTAGY